MEKNSFKFYHEWINQMDLLPDEEKIRFIYNLVRYDKGEDIELITISDKLVWNGVLPALRSNLKKYKDTVERNRINGKKGGRPPKNQENPKNQEISSITQKNPNNPDGFSNNPKNPIRDNSKEIKENRKEVIDNSKKKIDKGELVTGNSKQETVKEKIENSAITQTPELNVRNVILNSTYLRELFAQDKNDLSIFKNSLLEFLNEQKYPSYTIEHTMTLMVKVPSEWKDNLRKIGIEKFVQELSSYHQDDPREIGMLYAFSLRILNNERSE